MKNTKQNTNTTKQNKNKIRNTKNSLDSTHDSSLDLILKPYIIDERIKIIYSDPIVRKELYGSYRESVGLTEVEFNKWLKKNHKYGGNHIIQISKNIQKNDTILELASGTGWASAMLRDMGFKRITATDINPFDFNGLGALKRITKNPITTRIMSFEHIDVPKKSYDVVFMCSSLHHSSDVGNISRQVYSILKNNGKWFILGEPVRGLFDPENKSMMKSNKDGFNDNFYYWWHYRKNMHSAGFKIKVLFPDELHKMLNGELNDNCKTSFKKPLLSIAKTLYKISFGKKCIHALYPLSLYFFGSHSIIVCTK